MNSRDHFLHGSQPCRLQWSHAASWQEPHAFVLIAAVDNIDAIARDGMMERGPGVFGDEFEKSLPPRIIGVMKELFAERF